MKAWITYTIEDKDFVDSFKKHLQEAQIELLDVENEIMPGDNIVESIYEAISSAEIIFVILSKSSNERQWFSTEIGLIISEIRNNPHKKIIPILVEKQAKIPPFINQYQYLDVSDKNDADIQIEKLIRTLKTKEKKTSRNKNIDIISHELFLSKEDLLRKEKEEYENSRKQKQKLLSLTLVTTLVFTSLTVILFLFIGENSLFRDIDNNVFKTLTAALIGLLTGIIVSLFFERLKRK